MREIKTVGNRRIIAVDLLGIPHIATVSVGVKGIAGIQHAQPIDGNEKKMVEAITKELKALGNSKAKTLKNK